MVSLSTPSIASADASPAELVDQKERQRRDVLLTVAQRRALNREDAQAIEEVLSKRFLARTA